MNHTWWYLARSSGVVAWSLLAASVVWGLLLATRVLDRTPSPKWLNDLHRFLGGIAVVFTLLHVGTLVADSYVHFGAAEVLVLKALRSTRATVFGEPTAGALDYQSVQLVSLRTGDSRWALGYPTITAHADLPSRGMRGKGIAPDVRLDWRSLPDGIAEVERQMSEGR